MDQPPALALTAFRDAWPRATEKGIGTALCAIAAGRTLTFFDACASFFDRVCCLMLFCNCLIWLNHVYF